MKVLNLYDKNSDLRCYKKNIFKTMEIFLKHFPEEYKTCYKRNLDSLELFKVDRMDDETMTGAYNNQANVIFFEMNNSLGHELFHVASNDLVNNIYAFESKIEIEDGLIEGMTEYLTMKAYDLTKPGSYAFEVFSVTMLEDVPNIFRPYFIPNHKDFISLFPNKRDIYSLLYSLNTYNELSLDYLASTYTNKDILVDMDILVNSIRDTFNNLIALELSMEKDNYKLKEYSDKFMDYLMSDNVRFILNELYPNYLRYAEKQINKKVRKKR